jgi:hypothetical protein
MRGRAVAVLSSAILLTAVAFAPAAPAAATVSPFKVAYFNHPLAAETPQAGGPSEVTAAVLQLLAAAANKATVRIAMFEATLTGQPGGQGDPSLIEGQIVRDLQRGVTVSVVADKHKDHDFWNHVATDAGASASQLTVGYCSNSCFEAGVGIMHNKFILVDELGVQSGPVDDAVLQSSANWTYKQLNTHYWNNALQVIDDPALYGGYLSYWDALMGCASLAAQHCTGPPTATNQHFSGDSDEFVNVLPQGSPDPILDALDSVGHCSLADTQNVHTAIDIGVNTWLNDTRGTAILQKLRQLDAAGCPVRIVVPSFAPIASHLTGTDTLSLKAHCTGGGLNSPTEHNKYMLINGDFNGPGAQVVFTGTHRFNDKSLTDDDEILMRLTSSTTTRNAQNAYIYAQYEDNFEQMWNATPLCSAASLNPVGNDDDDLDP